MRLCRGQKAVACLAGAAALAHVVFFLPIHVEVRGFVDPGPGKVYDPVRKSYTRVDTEWRTIAHAGDASMEFGYSKKLDTRLLSRNLGILAATMVLGLFLFRPRGTAQGDRERSHSAP